MKKLGFLILCSMVYVSCSSDIPKDDFRKQMNKQCLKGLAMVYLGENATAEKRQSFCDCYTDYVVGNEDTISIEKIQKALDNQEQVAEALKLCVKGEETIEESEETSEPSMPAENED